MKFLKRKGTTLATIALGFAAVAVSLFSALIAARPANALDKVVYQYAWIPDGLFTPYSAGVAKGFYEEEGIDLTMRSGRGASDAVKKVAAGAATFGDGDISDVMRARVNENVPVRCIAHIHNHSPHALFALKSSGIKGIKDVEGKTLATTPGNSHKAYFPIVARRIGLDPAKVNWVVVEAAAMASLLVNKKVDAVPYYTTNAAYIEPQVKLIGDELLIFPFMESGFQIYGYCFYTMEETINKNPDLVRRFLRASLKSIRWAQANPQEAAELHNKRWPDISAKDALAGWDDTRFNMFGKQGQINWTGHLDPKQVQATYDAVAEAQNLDRSFDTRLFFNNDMLPAK
jgi:NitT/TauT family transport system substrate-binding protein